MKKTIDVVGMHCASCATLISRRLKKVPGVMDANVNYANQKALIDCSESVTDAQLIKAVEEAGYKAFGNVEKTGQHSGHDHAEMMRHQDFEWLKKKVIISAVLAIPAFWISMFGMDTIS